ncbi:MAG: ATP-binding cassette domain-containing protein [Planctomycetes bacterium]|nr:ATP-binding cassette domain-containing protein [Planctomycetota bacterium]
MIEVEDLRKNYGAFRALRGVDFAVDKGEILGFLGPNGAGKTTTMKILTGFLNPTSGKAVVAGHNVLEDSVAVRRRLGYLPEHTPLYEDMTVREYLRFCGRLRRMGGAHLSDRIVRVVGLTGLEPKFDALVNTLSKGYRQRVGIAQALLHEPEILILDEPTVGLDPNQVVDVRSLIREIGEDRTVILCSHILPEVEATCGRVVIIHVGEIVADGTPEELRSNFSARTWFDVKAMGETTRVTEVVGNVSGVAGVTATGEALGVTAVRFESVQPEGDTGPAVATALTGAGIKLVSLTPRRTSLEDVFRGLTRDEEN